MHDPLTVIKDFSVFGKTVIVLWHKDPGPGDDHCDWSNMCPRKGAGVKEVLNAVDRLRTILDNTPHYPDSIEHLIFQDVKKAVRELTKKPKRPWWRHPALHVWHWKVQFVPLQDFKRWAFSRCAKCGKRFPWGYAPVTPQWDNGGAKWFKGEKKVYHHECHKATNDRR